MLKYLSAELCNSALLALANSLPHRASGKRVEPVVVVSAHRGAWAVLSLDKLNPRRLLLAETCPVNRAVKATAAYRELSRADLSAYVADGLADLGLGGRHALASFVCRTPAAGALTAPVAEQVAELHVLSVTAQDVTEQVCANSLRHKVWQHICEVLSEYSEKDRGGARLGNLLSALFSAGQLHKPGDVDGVTSEWYRVGALCRRVAA
jgi:hypothetical protein